MRFGYFDDESREYVITTPDTPHPWINYLGTEDFFSLISHRAGQRQRRAPPARTFHWQTNFRSSIQMS